MSSPLLAERFAVTILGGCGQRKLPKEALCKSYTPSLGPSKSTTKRLPTRVGYRPDHCPQCQAAHGLTAHGFYRRTLVDAEFDGSIRVRRIGMLIVHTPPYQPEGRGKIERFFRSCRVQFLNNLDRKQTLSLEALNERPWAWLDVYHRTEHSSLGTTPLLRWQRDIEHIRQLPPATDFRRLFFHRLDGVVRRDCTFLLQNRFYEAPPHLADPAVLEIYFQGQLQGAARLVDPVVNGRLPSVKPAKATESQPTGINFVDLLIQKKDEEEPPW